MALKQLELDIPDGWNRVETEFDGQHACFMCGRNGLVVEVANYAGQFEVNTLPRNFYEDNQPIDYVWDSDGDTGPSAREEAYHEAETFMTEYEP